MNTQNYTTIVTKRLLPIYFLLLTLFANFNGAAQSGCMLVPLTLDSRVQQSSLIIEGQVVSQESFWGNGHRNIFTKSTVQVYKIFKGSASLQTIDVITQGGSVGDISQVLSSGLELHIGDMGVLTCIPNTYAESGRAGYTPYGSMQGFIEYDKDNGSAKDPFHVYNSIEDELYQSIKRITNRPIIEVSPNLYLQALKRRQGDNMQNTNRGILATPTITSFAPTSIASGTGASITITGTNFGTSQGVGFVEFKNANDGGGTWVKPLATDYVSWTTTQIVVKVPSASISGPGAGTGQIRVTNADPTTATSAATLTITYAYSNYPDAGVARMPTHITDNSFGGYTFLVNSSTFAPNVPAVNKLRSVLNYWTCTSGINWLLGGATTANAGSDGLNVATYSSSLSAGVLAQCISWYAKCGGTGAASNYYVSELDIEVNSTYTWYYGASTTVPAGQFDFESVMLHEMGHGHQLNHTIDATAVMHYGISSGSAKRTLNANEIAGATFIKNRDNTIGTVCSQAQMTTLACNASAGVPLVSFTANQTSVIAGFCIAFVSESAPEPTAWSWNFGGGAATSTLQNPNVTFTTPGTYSVTLTATNANGSASFTRSAYITVTAATCSTTLTNWSGSATDYNAPTSGKLVGHNAAGDLAFADKFTTCGSVGKLSQLKLYFNTRVGTGNITARVWSADGTAGAPGTVLFSQTVAISALQAYPNATVVTIAAPIAITGDYYVGYQITYAGSDAVSLISNAQGQSVVSTGWRLSSTSVWASYLSLYGLSLGLKVEAVFDNTPSATITPTGATTFCNGGNVVLNSNTNAAYTYLWLKNGATTGITTSTYTATTTGNYTVQVSYGSCMTTSAPTVVTVNVCNNADLSNLVPSTGTLSPIFAAATTSYALSVPFTTTSITVTPTLAAALATVKVNTVLVTSGSASGAIGLNVGSNTITTVVTAQDGSTTKTYTITVTRAAGSANANLSNLVPSTGSLSPVFATATIAYTISVPNATSSMTVTATLADATATVKVNTLTVISGSPSGSIALSVGSNTITTIVTAQDGSTTKTYTITVTRAAPASTNANLSNLVPSTGSLSPVFATATIAYTISVPNATSSMTITPTVADVNATVKVNTLTVISGSPSGSIALSVGSNTITTIVTAQDGSTTKTYTITVTRAAPASTNANLSNLVPSIGSLSPVFAAATIAYAISVPNATSSMTVTPTVTDNTATVKVNALTVTSGSPSGSIALSVGSNTITTIVTAQDGSTTKTYTITVTRAAPASTNANLSNLVPSAGSLSPVFATATIAYTISVPNATSSMTITPTVSDNTATVKVNTVTVTSGSPSGSIALAVGSNTITTVVTAQSGVTKTYTITVTRAAAPSSSIVNLKLYIEGYYIGGNVMTSVKFNQDQLSATNLVEDLTVELHHAATYALIATTTATLKTNGTMTCTFLTAPSGSFYIVVKGSNMIQTWSATPQTVGALPLNYDFTTAASKAYGNNMVQVDATAFAMYSGDINGDEAVDALDYSQWESDYNIFSFGVFSTDLNGDGSVDALDYSIWEQNYNAFIFANYPF